MFIKLFYKRTLVVLLFLLTYSTINAQNVGINSSGATPNASSGLDVSFTDKGVLIPRVALTGEKDASTITSPTNSLMVYNTATAGTQPYTVFPGFYYWQDSLWTRFQDRAGTVILTADRTNNNGTANTIADITGLSFPVASGVTYKFKFFIVYTSAATTTGSRWCINGPASPTNLNYHSSYSLTGTTKTLNEGLTSYNVPSGSNASSLAAGNIAEIEGIITPSANGTVIARFASEVASSAIVAKANLSYVQWEILK